jgi:hypothetical protein
VLAAPFPVCTPQGAALGPPLLPTTGGGPPPSERLAAAYRDSPDATHVIVGRLFICYAVAALVGAVVQVRRARKPTTLDVRDPVAEHVGLDARRSERKRGKSDPIDALRIARAGLR